VTKEKTAELLRQLRDAWPEEPPGEDETRRGMGAVMHLLFHSGEPVPAGEISSKTGVSTARTAVVLKKLEERGLIVRTRDPGDARKSLIALSEAGRMQSAAAMEGLLSFMGKVINEMGEDRFRELIVLAGEFRTAVDHNMKECPPPHPDGD